LESLRADYHKKKPLTPIGEEAFALYSDISDIHIQVMNLRGPKAENPIPLEICISQGEK